MPRWEILREPELHYDHAKNGHLWFYFSCGQCDNDAMPNGIKHHWHDRVCMYPGCGAFESIRHTCLIRHRKFRHGVEIKPDEWKRVSLKKYSPVWFDRWKDADDFQKWEESIQDIGE